MFITLILKREHRFCLLSKIVGFCAIILVASILPAMAENGRQKFNITSQPLPKALFAFSEQTKLVVLAPGEVTSDRVSTEVVGEYSPLEAIQKLLQNSGATYELKDEKTLLIRDANTDKISRLEPETNSAYVYAQADEQGPGQVSVASQAMDAKNEEGDKELEFEEIIVTGTHIRGVGLSVGSRVDIIDRAEIERSGYATVQQVLQSMPQNFGGGPNEDTRGGGANTSFTAASSINLSGLGTSSTLVLINGRRAPVAGLDANFIDVSTIPVTAIERVEILPDGASAIYGADAIAGVVNIILRDDYNGAETRVRFGTVTEGGSQEYQAGQTFGRSWDGGNILLSYEYYKRESLGYEEREYSRDNDLTPLGGTNFRDVFSNPGNILGFDGSALFAIPSNQDGTALVIGDFVPGTANRENDNIDFELFPDQERHSAYVSLSQNFGDDIEVFAEGRYSERDFSLSQGSTTATLFVTPLNPFFVDPTGFGFVQIGYDFGDDLGPLVNSGDTKSYNAVLGGTGKLPGDWEVNLYGSFSRELSNSRTINQIDFLELQAALDDTSLLTAFNPFGDGSHTNPATIEKIRSDTDVMSLSKVWSANLTTDGTLFQLPGGGVKMALGVNYRKELFDLTIDDSFGLRDNQFEREVVALFGELFVPLIGEDNSLPGIKNLVLSVAGRYEDYQEKRRGDIEQDRDLGSTTNPKIGLTWTTIEGLSFRGTYGTSFRAPDLPTLGATANAFNFSFTDPTVPGFPDPTLPGNTFGVLQVGTNPDLKNETATTWTVGVDIAPVSIPGLKFDLTYFNINFKDRITSPKIVQNILLEEDKFASIINRNPSAAEVDAICNAPGFLGDPSLCTLIPVGVIVDARLNNTAETKVSGLDFTLNYGFDLGNGGRITLDLNGNYILNFEEAFGKGDRLFELVDTVNNPVDFRMRNSLTYNSTDGFSATVTLNYADSYKDDVNVPERSVDSWTTFDLSASYSFGGRLGNVGLDNTVISFSVLNVFDTDPPFVNGPLVGYDQNNADPLGRFISLNITKRW